MGDFEGPAVNLPEGNRLKYPRMVINNSDFFVFVFCMKNIGI